MIELRMMMPDSAIVPSIATKPNGMPNASSAAVTPIMPSGAVSRIISVSEKLCVCIISSVTTTRTSSGTPAAIDFCPFTEFSVAPPTSMR